MKILLILIFLFSSFTSHSQTWKALDAEGEAIERHENAFVRAGDKFFLIGGRGEKPIDIYDTNTRKWSKGAQPPLEIHHFQAVNLDGLIYVLGGFTGGWPFETPLSHVLIYDPVADVWIIGDEIPEHRRRGAAGVSVFNQKIYISNGIINGHSSGWVNWFDEYDPYTNTWKRLPGAPRTRDHFQSVIIEDKLFAAGGRRSGSVEGDGFAGTVPETDVFNFKTMTWESIADIPTPRAGTAAVVFKDKPVIIGGESHVQEAGHSEVETYDPETKKWKNLTELNEGRHGTQAILVNDQIIIGAGSGNRGGGPELNSFEVFSAEGEVNFELDSLIKGELYPNKEELIFKTSEEVLELEIKNSGGNQALLLTYIQIDQREEFEVILIPEVPVIIAPGKKVKIQIRANQSGSSTANLYFKSPGQEPKKVILKK